jgi:hypothetical protein
MIKPSPYALFGPRYVERGYSALPIMPGTKSPGHIRGGEWRPMNDWGRFDDRLPTRFEIEIWSTWPGAGVGVVCGGLSHLVGVDIDSDDAKIAAAILSAIPSSPVAKRGAKGRTLFFRGADIISSKSWNVTGTDGKKYRACDLLGAGRFTVLPPTIHPDTGRPYTWLGPDTLENVSAGELPELTPKHVDAISEALRQFGFENEPERVWGVLPHRTATKLKNRIAS